MTWVRREARSAFRSLGSRNYRLFFVGQIISTIGTWMQSVAQAWLVLKLTGSGAALGAVFALQTVPFLFIGAWGGLVADRVDRRKVLIATQAAAASLALLLGILTLTGVVQLWMVMVLAFALGCVNCIDLPLRQTFVLEMVGKETLTNAISLNSVIMNGARVIGPAAAGLTIAWVGIGPTFVVNAASYIAVIVALVAIRPAELVRGERLVPARGQLRAGLAYVWSTPALRTPLLMMAVIGTFAYEFTVSLPLLSRFTFHTGAEGFGLMSSMLGAGAVVGGLYTASRGRVNGRTLGLAAIAFGILMTAAAAAPSYLIALLLLAGTGAASVTYAALSNSTLQLNSEPQMRGRVMALYAVAFMGSAPIGGPLVGWIGQAIGPRAAVAIGGVSAVLTGIVAWRSLTRAGSHTDCASPAASARRAGLGPVAITPHLWINSDSCAINYRGMAAVKPPRKGRRQNRDPLVNVVTPGSTPPPDPPVPRLLKKGRADQSAGGSPSAGRSSLDEARSKGPIGFLQLLGPGLITGASDDDPSGIGTYSQVGSQFGYGLLWTALFTFPLMAAVQEMCARIALQTGVGLGVSLRRKFPTWLVGVAILALLLANTINVGADLGAVAAGGSLLSRGAIKPIWLIIPTTALILGLQLFASYTLIFRIFKWLTLALFAYIVTAFVAHPNLFQVVRSTFIPHLELTAPFITALVAVLGTTISPYLFFWQASSEVDEMKAAGKSTEAARRGVKLSELHAARFDIFTGMLFSNVVMYFIILTSAAVLHAHGKTDIQTADQAAAALAPMAGPFAFILFAAGMIGAGLLAIPILSGSAAYALKEFLNLPGTLAAKPSFRPTFYAILAAATIAGALMNFVHIDPIKALFLTAVINGMVAPPLLILIVLLASDRKVMKEHVSGALSRTLTWAAAALMSVAALALVYTTWIVKA